jgi:hypothetical protein
MKSFIKIFFAAMMLVIISSQTFSQGPPPPKKSETIDMLIGTWVAEYQMMGATWTDETSHTWKHNGQYMFIEINAKDEKGSEWTSTIIINPQSDGSFTGYGVDSWGIVSTITGKAEGNKINAESKSAWGNGTRNIEINGNVAVHKLVWTMKGPDGKDQVTNMTITYNKKK